MAILLTACGGNEATPTEQPTTAAEIPPAPTEPTEPPTEAAPATAESATAVPAPTEAPTAEPAVAPVAGIPEAIEFTSGDCGNAFFPVAEGLVINYATTTTNIGDTAYSLAFSDVTDNSFTMTNTLDTGTAVTADWACTDGGLLSPNFGQMPEAMGGTEIEFVDASGFSIPPVESFAVGESWPTSYTANATMSISDSNTVKIVQKIDMVNTVTGVEAVSVAAGDFPEAYVVETTGTISMATEIMGTLQPMMSIELSYKSWYVEGIGLVRSEMADQGSGGYVSELTSITQE